MSKGYKKVGTKNGINKYEAVIEVGSDITGKRKRIKRVHYGNRDSAEVWYAELIKEFYHKGKKLNLNDITFKEYSEIFIKKYCIPNISKITTKGYQDYLKRIIPLIGDYKLKKINTFILDNMYQKIKLGKRKELSAKSMSHYYNLISIMFKQAKKWKFIDINPNEDAKKPKLTKRKRNYYNEEQVEKLYNCLENECIKYKATIILAIDSGIRRSELCALRWKDIDFQNNTIYIDNSLKVIDGVVDELKAKTEYSIRTIELGSKTMNVLYEYKKWQDNYIIEMRSNWKGTDRVFTDNYGNYMYPSTTNNILQKIIKKYHLPKITFHELRHTCASILNNNGINAKAISDRLGHADASITLNTYTHTFESSKSECANVFDNLQKSALLLKNN